MPAPASTAGWRGRRRRGIGEEGFRGAKDLRVRVWEPQPCEEGPKPVRVETRGREREREGNTAGASCGDTRLYLFERELGLPRVSHPGAATWTTRAEASTY